MHVNSWLGLALLATACSAPSSEAGGPAGEPSDATSPTTSGSGGTAGDQQSATAGSAGTGGGTSQPLDSGTGSGGVQEDSGAKPFACTQVIGVVLTSVVNNIKTKYPSARAIDLLSIIRGPANKACDPSPNPPENTKIPAGLDDAIAKVALANPGLVQAGPKIEATACSDFTGVGPHLTSAGNMKMAALYAAYYARLP